MSDTKPLALALAGPLAAGAVLGLPGGASAVAGRGLGITAVLLGVAALTAPMLYVGVSLAGVAPAAATWLKGGRRAAIACGTLLLGVTPPLAFLLATSSRAAAL